MRKAERNVVGFVLFAVVGTLLAEYQAVKAPLRDVEIQGRIICLDETKHRTPCKDEAELFGFLTSDGQQYYFMTHDARAKMFRDPRIRERELIVKGRLRPQRQIEITKVWSVKNGQKFDIYYFCSVCNIKAHVGGLCWCCQREFELREEPSK